MSSVPKGLLRETFGDDFGNDLQKNRSVKQNPEAAASS